VADIIPYIKHTYLPLAKTLSCLRMLNCLCSLGKPLSYSFFRLSYMQITEFQTSMTYFLLLYTKKKKKKVYGDVCAALFNTMKKDGDQGLFFSENKKTL